MSTAQISDEATEALLGRPFIAPREAILQTAKGLIQQKIV